MTEPSNEQLANFLVVYAEMIPELKQFQLQLNPTMLEMLMDRTPQFREAALRHHRDFQQGVVEMEKKVAAGALPCQYRRPNGKMCPNYNEPGLYFCGLHKDQDKE